MISKFFLNSFSKSLFHKVARNNSQLFQQAQIAQSVGHYSNAISFYQKFLQSNDQVNSMQVFNSHKFMGEAFLKMNRVNQSHSHYILALEEFYKLTNRNKSDEIALLNKAAETSLDLSKALDYVEKSLSLCGSSSRDNHLQMESLRIKSQILESMGLKQDALNICGQILMQSESNTSVDYKYAQKKRLIISSLDSFQEVSKELDQIIISEHKSKTKDVPESIYQYYQISLKLWRKKEYFRSFQYVQRALQLAEVLRGTSHSDFYQCLDLIGQHLVLQGRIFEAEFYYQKALNSVVQGKGPYHEDVVYYKKALADLYVLQEKYQLAHGLYEESLILQQKYYPLDASQTLDTNFKITLTEYKQGKAISEVKDDLEWMLGQFSKKIAVKNDKLQSQITYELAQINLNLNNLNEAQRLFQEFLILEDNLDQMLDAYLNLGYIEMMRKDFDKANSIFERCKLFVKDETHPKFQKIAEQQILVQQMSN